ncbi:TPA: LysR family transcriptional regulator, partial [Bacillus cytotoxicus]|nr:LysR family transcriptional regulator [Bacillus cytotoxicus]
MEINDLIIFKTVVSEGSISKAAKELGYVQPNVTERIKRLEQELETPLLHRNNKGVSLLPSGDILLDYTNKILNLIEEAKNEIKMSDASYRIATSQSILSDYLSIRIKENFRNYQ